MQLKADPLLLAAMALPGLLLSEAGQSAGTQPVDSVFELHLAHYADEQSDASRMRITSPSVYWLTPVGDRWSVASTLVLDSLSGASPLFHDTLSGASGQGIHDFRRAIDVELTRHLGYVDWSFGLAHSDEADYDSGALRSSVRIDSADRNQTWTLGIGGSNDHIDSVNDLAQNRYRRTRQLQLGWTRVLDPQSLFSVEATWSYSSGYHDDPYKPLDFRPAHRRLSTLSGRYYRFVERAQATLRMELRLYDDDWSISAQSLDVAWEQPINDRVSLTPHLRYHTQSAAFFYVDPPFGLGFELGQPYSADTRLAAFGALTLGLGGAVELSAGWRADLSVDLYRQRQSWRVFGDGSPGVQLIDARIVQLGLRRQW